MIRYFKQFFVGLEEFAEERRKEALEALVSEEKECYYCGKTYTPSSPPVFSYCDECREIDQVLSEDT